MVFTMSHPYVSNDVILTNREALLEAVFGEYRRGDPTWDRLAAVDVIRQLIDSLPEREARAVSLRFGLLDKHPLVYEEVGKRLSPPISRDRARQVTVRAFSRMRGKVWEILDITAGEPIFTKISRTAHHHDRFVSDTANPAQIETFVRDVFKTGYFSNEPDLTDRYNSVEGARLLLAMLRDQRDAEIVSLRYGLGGGATPLSVADTFRRVSRTRTTTYITVYNHLRTALLHMQSHAQRVLKQEQLAVPGATPIMELPVSSHTWLVELRIHCGVHTVEELASRTDEDLLAHHRFDQRALREIREAQAEYLRTKSEQSDGKEDK
jgi:hypothetical protein